MKHLLTFTKTCWAVILVAAIGFESYGCSDSASISEDVAVPLSSLTITPGSLQPGFFKNTTSYVVEVSTTASSVTVTATPKDSTTTMTINAIDTNPGQGRIIPLSPSGTTTNITIVLANQNGIESTYNILVRKVDNTLSALSVTPPGAFPSPGFNPSTLTYQLEVPSGVSSVAIVATKTDLHAVMSGSVIAAAGITTGKATIRLNDPGQPTVVSITVAVKNGEAKTYTITVNRLSGDNKLEALTVTPGTFDRPFNPAITDYTVDVAKDIDKVTISATKSDINASMSGNLTAGPGIKTDTQPLNLGGQGTETDFFITVAAPDSTVTPKVYKITVIRAASSDNKLSALSLTGTTATATIPLDLTPSFDRNHPDYTVEAPFDVQKITVTATKSDSNAVMSGSVTAGTGVPTGQEDIFFLLLPPPPPAQISITVRAPDGTPKTYTITVNRVVSNDNKLSALSLTGTTATATIPLDLTPSFDRNHPDYTVEAPFDVQKITVTATKSDSNAVMSGSVTAGTGVPTGQEDIFFLLLPPPPPPQISITVTAVDGTPKTYTITVNQAPPLAP